MNSSPTFRNGLQTTTLLIIAAFWLAIITACSDRKDFTIGYIGPQTGANGALLAAAQLSSSTETKGRPITIISSNSELPGFQITQAQSSMVKSEFRVILEAVGEPPPAEGKSDRTTIIAIDIPRPGHPAISAPLVSAAGQMADQLRRDRIASVSVVVDEADRNYHESWLQVFQQQYEKNQGVIRKTGRLNSEQIGWEKGLSKLLKSVLSKESRGLVVVAETKVAWLVCRQARQLRKKPALPVALAESALPAALLALHDKNLDGVLAVKMFATPSEQSAFEQFVKDYRGNFGSSPNLSAANAYDAVGLTVAAARLKKKLADGFAALAEYHGVLGTATNTNDIFQRTPQLVRISRDKIVPAVSGKGKKKS